MGGSTVNNNYLPTVKKPADFADPHKDRAGSKGGFTLTEVLIASAILAGALGAVYSGIITMQISISSATNHIEAQSIAFDEIWSTLNMPWSQLENYTSPNTRPVSTNSGIYNFGGTIRTSVLPTSNRCDIIVRVDWLQKSPGGQVAAFETYSVARYDTAR